MRKLSAVCLLSLPILSACGPLPPLDLNLDTSGAKRALDTVDLRQPNVTLTIPSTGQKYRSGQTFAPPKTIDCSRLSLEKDGTDGFKEAIEAGALVVEIQTPPEAKRKVVDKDGKETVETVNIKPTYSGVLALCKVSPRATGPEARSYHIRDLDDRFINGQNGIISAIGGQLSQNSNQADPFQELLNISMGPSFKKTVSAGGLPTLGCSG